MQVLASHAKLHHITFTLASLHGFSFALANPHHFFFAFLTRTPLSIHPLKRATSLSLKTSPTLFSPFATLHFRLTRTRLLVYRIPGLNFHFRPNPHHFSFALPALYDFIFVTHTNFGSPANSSTLPLLLSLHPSLTLSPYPPPRTTAFALPFKQHVFTRLKLQPLRAPSYRHAAPIHAPSSPNTDSL